VVREVETLVSAYQTTKGTQMNQPNSEIEPAAGSEQSENEEAQGRQGDAPKPGVVAAKDPTTTVPRDELSDTTVRRDQE
jgi:hypothetical protein